MRANISRNHDSVLAHHHHHHEIVERIERIIPEASPFSVQDRDTSSGNDWGLNSDATVGEVLEAMHNRIFGFSRDLDGILASDASMRLTQGQEESFPVPPEIPLEEEEEEEEEKNENEEEKNENEEHFVLPSDPPGLTDEIDENNKTEGNDDPPHLYPDVMTPPPGLDGMVKKPKDSPIEWIDESERERRRLEAARRRSNASAHPVLNASEAMDVGQRNNFSTPKGVVMDFSIDEILPDVQISHERAIRKRLRNRYKQKSTTTTTTTNVIETSQDEEEDDRRMSEIDRTTAAIDRLQNELESSRSKAKELEAQLSRRMSKLGMQSESLRQQQRSSERVSSKVPSTKKFTSKPLPPLSLEQTWLSTPASRLPRASAVFNGVMNSLTEKKEFEERGEESNSREETKEHPPHHRPLSEKEMSMIRTFRAKYGKRRVGVGVEPIADEDTVMSSKQFHMKLMGMSPLSRHPEPYSGVESPHARLWDFKPVEYTEPEALNSNIKIAEIESLKQRTPSRRRRGGRR